jgi:hypothetical protein
MPEKQQPPAAPAQEERKSSLFTDILTIVGFAILFIIILWGLVHLFQLVSSSFLNGNPSATIQVNAPAQVTSGEQVTISWSYSPAAAGSYAFLYQCQNGLTFDLQTSTSSKSAIPCGVAYTTPNQNNSVTLTPMLSATSSVEDTVYVVFIPRAQGSRVQGDASMTVEPAAKSASTKTSPRSSGTGAAKYAGTGYAGPADLSVRIVSAYVDQSGAGVATFEIANVGGSTSGSYTFSAQLPTMPAIPYFSPQQAPLAPGAYVTSTLRFTDVAPGGGSFSVSINGNDANASNDYASIQLAAPYYNNSYNYPQPYPTYTY